MRRRHSSVLAAVVVACIVGTFPTRSSAAPPILQSVSFDNGTHVLSVTWSLPPGVESSVLEANANPALDSEGYFLYGPNDGYFGPNIIFEVPDSASTSWVHSYPGLPPGHYYVHVAGFDNTCFSCPIREWTSLGTFDVAPHPTPGPPHPTPCVVPKVVGKSLATAKRRLVASHCRAGRVAYGHSRLNRGLVFWQSQRPGLRFARGTRVGLLVSLGRRRVP